MSGIGRQIEAVGGARGRFLALLVYRSAIGVGRALSSTYGQDAQIWIL